MKIKTILAAISILSVMTSSVLFAQDSGMAKQRGYDVHGWYGEFNKNFISCGEHSVTGFAKVVLNGPIGELERKMGYTNAVDFIQSAWMRYRWRVYNIGDTNPYMHTEEWKAIFMVPNGPDSMRTIQELEIPNFECDIEYYFVGTRKTPYYEYVDYSGMNIPVSKAGYTECPPLYMESHYDNPNGFRLPSGGTNWFVRVRKGKSNVRGMRLK